MIFTCNGGFRKTGSDTAIMRMRKTMESKVERFSKIRVSSDT
ncbi:MAG: hypothetical protein ACXACG_18930 [Candidatus Thorarchaeota archaeon]